jgi:hypothetical protein
MKTTGLLSVVNNNAAFEDVVTNNFSAVQPSGELFAFLKKIVREVAVDLPALIAMKLTNIAGGTNSVCVVEPQDAISRDNIMGDFLDGVGQPNIQTFTLQPEAETGLVKSRGLWLPTEHVDYESEDLRYILRSFALPAVVRSYEAAVPAPSGTGTVTEETDERVYTVSGLISAIQKGCENDTRFGGKQLGYVIDERAKKLHVAVVGEGADTIPQTMDTARGTVRHINFICVAPAAQTDEPAEFELV